MITKANSFKYEDIYIGQKAEFTAVVTDAMVNGFASLVGDYNPLHMDEEYASQTKFKGRIAHGMLVASFLSTLLGMYCPGKNNLYLSQNLNFRAPLKIGETIRVTGEIKQKADSVKVICVKTVIYNAKNNIILDGEAKVMVG